jgi:nicotinate-nucleotide adenylyltransferase
MTAQTRYTLVMETIGLFGGTFDPPHSGHLVLAAEARRQLMLDHLLWVLTPVPPHKTGKNLTPLEHRLAMVALALKVEPANELSRLEIDRPGPHFAIDTVKLMKQQAPAAEIVYIMGGDSLRDLPTWRQPTELVAACHMLGVMRRPEDAIDLDELERKLPGVSAKVRFITAPLLEISSNDIRQRIRTGKPFRHLLPEAVYHYILENDLYR